MQYEYWILGFSDMAISFPTEVRRVYSPVIIAAEIIISAGAVVLDILLKTRSSFRWCMGAAVFVVCAVVVDRLVKGLVPRAVTERMSAEGANGAALAGYHANALRFLDTLLLPLFAVSLTLMMCVCYNKRCPLKIE